MPNSSTLILLKGLLCFILFLLFQANRRKRSITMWHCVNTQVSYLWRCVCLVPSEIAGKKHSFQCRAAVEVHQSMFWLIERSGGNQQVRDYTSGSRVRQDWETWQKLDLSCAVSCNLSFCLLHPHWGIFILFNLSHRQQTTPLPPTPIFVLLPALDSPIFFPCNTIHVPLSLPCLSHFLQTSVFRKPMTWQKV